MPKSIESQQYEVLVSIEATLKAILAAIQTPPAPDPTLPAILAALKPLALLQQIADDLAPESTTVSAAIAFGGTTMPATPGTLAVGSTLQASFVPLLADGTVNTTSKLTTSPTWSSSDTSIATVDTNGLVTGVAAGTATITGTGGSFTDSDGTIVGPLDASNTVSDTAPVQRTVSAQVSFS